MRREGPGGVNSDLEAKPCVEFVQVQLPERGVELKRLLGAKAAAQVSHCGVVLMCFKAFEPCVERCAHPREDRVVHPVQELVGRLRCLTYRRVVARLALEERPGNGHRQADRVAARRRRACSGLRPASSSFGTLNAKRTRATSCMARPVTIASFVIPASTCTSSARSRQSCLPDSSHNAEARE